MPVRLELQWSNLINVFLNYRCRRNKSGDGSVRHDEVVNGEEMMPS